jgi:hypothetical protein
MSPDQSRLLKAAQREGDPPGGEFRELFGFTLAGFAGGMACAMLLDAWGFQRTGWGQWIVRTLSGEGESLLEGVYALRKRLLGGPSSMAEAYGWGKLLGMGTPWAIDGASRLAGLNPYGLETFYIPYFYALSDQMGANVAGLLYLRRGQGRWSPALRAYLSHPVMLASLGILLTAPGGLLAARALGFQPSTQVLTAAETIAANLCWLPPAIGLAMERVARRGARKRC